MNSSQQLLLVIPNGYLNSLYEGYLAIQVLKAKTRLSLQAKTGLGTQGQEELRNASALFYTLRIEFRSIYFEFEFDYRRFVSVSPLL